MPFLFEQVLHYQVDLFLFCIFGSALCHFFRAILQNKNQYLVYFFLLFGLALGTKYNAVLQAFILIPLVIYAAFYFRNSLKIIWWYPFLSILTGGIWYIRNFIVTGNPIYPFGLNLGFINFEGHQTFTINMPGSSIMENIEKTNFRDVMGKIFQNNEFDKLIGNISLILFVLAIFCLLLGIFYFLNNRLRKDRKEKIIKTILFVLLFYLFIAEIFVYFRSPYTFTLWQETIRYIAPLLGLLPVIFVLTAGISSLAAITICIVTLPIIAFNIIYKSFIINPDFLSIISEKLGMIPSLIPLLLIMIFLIIFVLLIFNKKTNNYYTNIIYLLIISILISTSQSHLSFSNTELDDNFINKNIIGYSLVLPHLQKLRELPKNNDIIAVAGMTTYWLFEKEGFRPVYINIDGCKKCKYPDYRNLEHSVREYQDEVKWKNLLKEENVKYLLTGSISSRSTEQQLYERKWADSDPVMFKILLKENDITLYEIIDNNSLL